jgi:hypothetical protein
MYMRSEVIYESRDNNKRLTTKSPEKAVEVVLLLIFIDDLNTRILAIFIPYLICK